MRFKQPLIFAGSLLLAATSTYLDHVTGDELAFTIFYVVPVVVATWYGGRRMGLFVALACGGAWLADDVSLGMRSVPGVHLWNALVTVTFFVIITVGLSHIREDNERLAAMALSDPMTGIPNARAYYRRAEAALARMRQTGRPLTAVYLDLDNFKEVNDTRGHAAGDRLLQEAAGTLQAGVRDGDFVARLGGDEFAILLEETGAEEAGRVLARLRADLAAHLKATHPRVTASFGAVTFAAPPSDVEEMQHRADAAMDAVKSGGKDGLRLETA